MDTNPDQEPLGQTVSKDGQASIHSSDNDVKIKSEQLDDWKFKSGEKITLMSDDEDDDDITAGFTAGQISKKASNAQQPGGDTITSQSGLDREMLQGQIQQKLLQRFRVQHPDMAISMEGGGHPSDNDDVEPSFGQGLGKKSRGKDDEAAAHFAKMKKAYLKKKAANSLTIEEEVDFLRAESAESARLRKLEADEDYDNLSAESDNDGSGLFVKQAAVPSYSALYSDVEDDQPAKPKKGRKRKAKEDSEDETSAKRTKKTKKDRKVPGTRYTEDDLNDVLGKAKAKKGAKDSAKKNTTKKTTTGRGKKNKPEPTMTNLNSIRGTNIFRDAAAVANLPAPPGFEQERGARKDALSKLIASVPVESKEVAHSDKRYLDACMRDFTGRAAVYPKDGNWGVQGMKSALKHYQVMGTAFMRRRENAPEEPRGGILADEMGLGKTVMMLANIVNGRPKAGKTPRATLVIASPSLVNQWNEEIRTHCLSRNENKQHGIGTVLQYRSGHRILANNLEQILEDADIVLTTYHEVLASYPKATVPTQLVTAAQKDTWWKEYYERERGILHRIQWLRVVLDEATAIKNHLSRTSMACRALSARHYWAITGTPILNNSKEFYSYLRLIREPNTGSFRIFCHNFCHPDDPDGNEKLNVFLRKIMIRRTHIDTLFNARLLELPQPQEHTIWLEFSDIERQIYEIVKKRFIQRINRLAKQKDAQQQVHHIWTMILRLRQICAHVLLIQESLIELLERDDYERLNSLTLNEQGNTEEGEALLIHLKTMLKTHKGLKTIEGGLGNSILTENESLPTDVIGFDNTDEDTGGKHGLSFRFRKYLTTLMESEHHWEAIKQRTLCCGCRQPPLDPQVTSCFHIYCAFCLIDLQHSAARRGRDRAICSECGEAYTETKPCQGIENLEADRNTSTPSSTDTKAVKKTGKGKKKDEDEMEDWISARGEVLPSAKSRAVKAQVMNWLEEDPTVKVVIFCQFLSMVRILSRICKTEGWTYAKYTGTMSYEARDRAINDFGANPETSILLASLKAGGLGLNLTMASRVICLDPWWNMATETQAFARVYRIGQNRETRFLRLVVKNSIDEALMAIKDRKQIEIDNVMQDKSALSVRDLMELFGRTGEDGDGHPFIFAEGADCYDENDPEHLRLLVDVDENDELAHMGNEA